LKKELKEDRDIRQTEGQNKKHIKQAYRTKDQLEFISLQFINKRVRKTVRHYQWRMTQNKNIETNGPNPKN
jgi:hypothetical protein